MTIPLPGITDPGPIADAQEGMTVLDANGDLVGTVTQVKMGDPEAATGQGQAAPATGGLVAGLVRSLSTGDSLPRQQQERLLRLGYLQLDRADRFTGSSYVTADHVVAVRAGQVHLDITEADLFTD